MSRNYSDVTADVMANSDVIDKSTSRMVYIYLSDTLLNSAWMAARQNGKLYFNITPEAVTHDNALVTVSSCMY